MLHPQKHSIEISNMKTAMNQVSDVSDSPLLKPSSEKFNATKKATRPNSSQKAIVKTQNIFNMNTPIHLRKSTGADFNISVRPNVRSEGLRRTAIEETDGLIPQSARLKG